jgi:deoxycytidine triphosphate deaminase
MNKSYLLNYEEIKEKNLFEDGTYVDSSFRNSDYYLTIDRIIIIGEENSDKDCYEIPPQGLVVAISKEIFNLPENIIGYTTVKNSLSVKGLLAINVGLVDPLYNGPISSALINFGKAPILIRKKDPFLRMTFHQFNKPQKPINTPINKSKKQYLEEKINSTMAFFDNTFLSLKSVKKEVKNDVIKEQKEERIYFFQKLTGIGILIAACSFAFSILINTYNENRRTKILEEKITYLEKYFDYLKHSNK